jgi:phosphoenolpyruvate-protein phosphotransferase (PTS system enzyme I)
VQVFKGITANPGIAIGPAYHFNRALIVAEERTLEQTDIAEELRLFDDAIGKAKLEMEKISRIAEQKAGTHGAAIFEAQKMMIEDKYFLDSIRYRIKSELKSAAYIVDAEFTKQQHVLETSESPLMRERVDDVEDVKQRLLRHLLRTEKLLSKLTEPAIVVAEFLTPADAILFSKEELLGFAMDGGGQTSHVSILARSVGLPAIVALHNAAAHVETGNTVIIDGGEGTLIVSPDEKTLLLYQEKQAKQKEASKKSIYEGKFEYPPKTIDEHPVAISMNMELIGEEAIVEAEKISKVKGEVVVGLGLVRTEHFLNTNDEIPSEPEQTRIYSELARRFSPAIVTIRTFDIGGDKFIGGGFREKNPFLGWRGIRISLDEPETFMAQVRSILRASANKNVKLMLPMVTSVDELDRTLQMIYAAKSELRSRGEDFDDDIPIGAMIEVPAAALLADAFALRCDFLSIGSNDLTQYTLAVDRGNEFIVHLFDELHPAVLRLIQETVAAAHRHKKPVSLCGEMGAKNFALPVILGLGIDEISVSPVRVGMVSHLIGKLQHSKTKNLVKKLLESSVTAQTSKEIITDFMLKNNLEKDFLK